MNQNSIDKIQALLQQVQSDDKAAREELVSLLRPGVALFLSRSVKLSEVEGLTENALRFILESAERSAVTAQDVITITLDTVHTICGEKIKTGASEIRVSRNVLARIAALPERTRTVLYRYYALGESREHICRNMNLSREDFQTIKDDGKAAINGYRLGRTEDAD